MTAFAKPAMKHSRQKHRRADVKAQPLLRTPACFTYHENYTRPSPEVLDSTLAHPLSNTRSSSDGVQNIQAENNLPKILPLHRYVSDFFRSGRPNRKMRRMRIGLTIKYSGESMLGKSKKARSASEGRTVVWTF